MNRIREEIKGRGFTITSLADKMGMTRENLTRIIASPSTPTLEKLSEALGVPVWRFFASGEEVLQELEGGGQVIVCPHCGNELHIVPGKVKE